MELIEVKASDYGLEESKAKQISEMFKPMLDKMVELEEEYNEVIALEINPETCKKARELRLRYVKTRTNTGKIHKELKSFYLQGGKFVDGWKNAQLMASQGNEEKLKAIEEHFERIEKEKKNKLSEERKKEVLPFVEDESTVPNNLGEMIAEVWEAYRFGVEKAYNRRKEEEKIKEQQKQIAEERKKKILAYWNFIDPKYRQEGLENLSEEDFNKCFEQSKKAFEKDKEKKQKIEAENKRLKEAEKKRQEEYEAQKKKDQEEKDRLIAENKKKEDKIKNMATIIEENKSEPNKELLPELKTDKEKFLSLIKDLSLLRTKYNFEDKKYQEIYSSCNTLIGKTITFIKSKENEK